jgi:hypothetical protein
MGDEHMLAGIPTTAKVLAGSGLSICASAHSVSEA